MKVCCYIRAICPSLKGGTRHAITIPLSLLSTHLHSWIYLLKWIVFLFLPYLSLRVVPHTHGAPYQCFSGWSFLLQASYTLYLISSCHGNSISLCSVYMLLQGTPLSCFSKSTCSHMMKTQFMNHSRQYHTCALCQSKRFSSCACSKFPAQPKCKGKTVNRMDSITSTT